MAAAAADLTAAADLKLEVADIAPHYASIVSGGSGGPCAAVIAPDGSIVAAYVSVTTVKLVRVTSPATAAQWSWGTFDVDAREVAGVCLVVSGSTVRLIFQRGSTTNIRFADSTDNGVTWSAVADLFAFTKTCYGLAAEGNLNLLFVAYDNAGAGAVRLAVWRNSAGWSGVDWTNGDLNTISGIAATATGGGSYALALACQGVSGLPYAIQSAFYTPAWSALSPIERVDTNVGLIVRYPHLTQFDGLYRLTYVEQDTGSSSGLVYTRLARTASADFVHWQAATPDLVAMPHGAVWLRHASGQVLAAPEAVRLAPAYDPAAGYRDLTGDLLRLDLREREGEPARLVATLDNSTGIYTALPALRVNAQVLLSQGYVGAGLIPTHLLYIEEWTFARAADEQSVTITAYDAARRLSRQSRYPLSYANRTVGDLLGDLAALAGFERAAAIDASVQFSQTVDQFQLPPGHTYLAAARRLLAAYDGALWARAVPGAGPAFGAVDLPVVAGKSAAPPVVWSYSGEPEHLHLTHAGDRANHVLVFGPQRVPTAIAEAWDAPDLANTGQERYAALAEGLATSAAAASLVANLALAREIRLATRVALAVAPHPGLELQDAIAIADPVLPSLACRVIALSLTYDPHTALHDLVLACEGI